MEWQPQIDTASRARAVDAAQGKAPFDRLLCGGTLVDVITGELREADIGIVGPMIASVHARNSRHDAESIFDASGKFLAPGLIDAHVHFESSHMLPHYYASTVVPQGTTTIFYDPHELANVLGIEGVRYAIASGVIFLSAFCARHPLPCHRPRISKFPAPSLTAQRCARCFPGLKCWASQR